MSELYELPDGWEWKTIEDLCEILDRLRKPISQRDRISGEFPYYGASGILDYIKDYIFDERLFLIGEDGAKWGANENTSFIADGKYWVNNHAHILQPKNFVNIHFIAHLMELCDYTIYISGAAQPKLTKENLMKILFLDVPLNEQNQIVDYLEKIEEKIAKAISLKQQEIEKLKECKTVLVDNVVTGKVKIN